MEKRKKYNLLIVGEIDDSSTKDVINLFLENDITDKSDIDIYISSPGGDLHSCFAMIDFIEGKKQELGFNIRTHGLGEVCSGGFFMFLLGDKRIAYPKTRMYVHEHVVEDGGGEPYTKKMKSFKEERILNKLYVEFVADRLDIPFNSAKSLVQKDKWLTDKEITEYNILSEGK
jgi:ATP-dependent Clp protease protease subunit